MAHYKKRAKRRVVLACVTDEQKLERLTAEMKPRNRPECCQECGSRSSTLVKFNQKILCVPCSKGETEKRKEK